MMTTEFDRKKHWENIYTTKQLNEVSWYQLNPETALSYVQKFNLPKNSKIIDIGGGDSFFADALLESGYTNITVLDISEASLERAKERLGDNAGKVNWIVSDITEFNPAEKYDFWFDRAAFHFLTSDNDVANYISNAVKAIADNGIAVIGTFSENGPLKCSGIEIKQYSKEGLASSFEPYFDTVECINLDHKTPFDTVQNFTFCSFRKK
ncbi:class I SAM-dependent methyltransferase [Flavobacterium rakeshii]|uniref:class I SAM-dependent methyltransferase n=1 Tax=Flavobacterium rakeshii TaxID=1038845 RepID=UPI002E7AFF63|nr:class I SAM-dependent methyltransferase [Flavobacterium rakeshii]MEE1897379.1 class I SAM-dependent methyltransferase [Flavobacterium rakeshii]